MKERTSESIGLAIQEEDYNAKEAYFKSIQDGAKITSDHSVYEIDGNNSVSLYDVPSLSYVMLTLRTTESSFSYKIPYKNYNDFREMVNHFMTKEDEEKFCQYYAKDIAEAE